MTKTPELNDAYALETPDDNRRLYATWADTYDEDFARAHGYRLPQAVADAFVAAGGTAPLLDIGAGTGQCAIALAGRLNGRIDALDISAEMLGVAQERRLYHSYFEADLLAGLDISDATYAGVISAGTFTHGHVGPDALREVLRVLQPGGLAVLSVNRAHFEAMDFPSAIADLSPMIARQEISETRIYGDGATDTRSEDTAMILHLWKG